MAAKFGWRFAFFMVGIPGVVLGLTALRLPKSVAYVAKESMPLRELLRVPAFLALLVSGWFCSFAGYSYVAWGPELIQEYKGFSAEQAGIALGLVIVLGGTLGIATGAFLSDALAKLRVWGRAVVVPIGFVLAAPPIYFALHASGKLRFLVLFGLGAFFLSWYHGPSDCDRPRLSSSARARNGLRVLLFVREPVFDGNCASSGRKSGGPLQPDYGFACTAFCATCGSGVFYFSDPMHPARRAASSGTGPALG